MADKKYYWLKLQRDFFKRHDIRIIEAMPNGKDYVLFYLKLLVESIDHSGELRFSDTVPYSEQMLSVVTNTNIDTVRAAMQVFTELKMIDIMDDSTIFMTEVSKLTGCETKWAEKKRIYRGKEDNVLALSEPCPQHVRQEIEIELELDKEIDKEIDKELEKDNIRGAKTPRKTSKFSIPSLDDVKSYCLERNNRVDPERFIDFYTSNGWMVGKNKMKDWKAAVRTWEAKDGRNTGGDEPKRKKHGTVV